jgi:hypothetical protein
MPAENVVVYTAAGCRVCHTEMEFLSQHNVQFNRDHPMILRALVGIALYVQNDIDQCREVQGGV